VILVRLIVCVLALVGLACLILGGMLAVPLRPPPVLDSVLRGARAIDQAGIPPETRFQARDGTWLAYRMYPAADASTARLAILVHGSAGSSAAMNAVARALSAAGVAAASIDLRGHGASGTRGDVAYVGQPDDDLDDLIAELRRTYPTAALTLIGHSSGGGFALRIAAEPRGRAFGRFVLIAPYLGYTAPTNRAAEGPGLWAAVDVPRILAISLLRAAGLDWADALPVIAFALPPEVVKYTTQRYSFRLLTSFGPPQDWRAALAGVAAPTEIIAGEADELMDAPRYREVAAPTGGRVKVTLLPGIDHLGILSRPEALAAIVAAATR